MYKYEIKEAFGYFISQLIIDLSLIFNNYQPYASPYFGMKYLLVI